MRSAHRSAISQADLRSLGFVRLFLLAEIPAHEKFITQQSIESESQHFNDILQGMASIYSEYVDININALSLFFFSSGNFLEAYRNLTYKHVMGLKWASSQTCYRNTKFIIKMDDDIVVDFYYLSHYLRTIRIVAPEQTYLAGYVLSGVTPIRLRQNKWYVSQSEYMGDMYPDYLSGWMYVMTPVVAKRLVHAATRATPPFFWIDDTWVTGVLRTNEHIPINDTWNALFSANSQFLDCCITDLEMHQYRCPFVAGPNGGDHRLITKFLQTTRQQCFTASHGDVLVTPMPNQCHARSQNLPALTNTCVGIDKHLLVETHGAAIVNAFKL